MLHETPLRLSRLYNRLRIPRSSHLRPGPLLPPRNGSKSRIRPRQLELRSLPRPRHADLRSSECKVPHHNPEVFLKGTTLRLAQLPEEHREFLSPAADLTTREAFGRRRRRRHQPPRHPESKARADGSLVAADQDTGSVRQLTGSKARARVGLSMQRRLLP
jgi:hypothetical protein